MAVDLQGERPFRIMHRAAVLREGGGMHEFPLCRACANGSSPSTTKPSAAAKIRRPTEGRIVRRKALPLPGAKVYGLKTPVTVKLEYRGGSEPWVQISYSQGHFFRLADTDLMTLIEDLVRGDVWLRPEGLAARQARRKR